MLWGWTYAQLRGELDLARRELTGVREQLHASEGESRRFEVELGTVRTELVHVKRERNVRALLGTLGALLGAGAFSLPASVGNFAILVFFAGLAMILAAFVPWPSK